MELYKLLMFGARDWTDDVAIGRELLGVVAELKRGQQLLVIEGGASGADYIAGAIARSLNLHVAEVKALWNQRGRGAGPQRNEIMALLEPDRAIGFHANIENSKGSKDMLNRCKAHHIPVKVVTE